MHRTHPENIQEHRLQVALIAHALGVIRNQLYDGAIDAKHVALLALYHNAHEVLTGDLLISVKYFNADIAQTNRTIEAAAQQRLLGMLPEALRPAYASACTHGRRGWPPTSARLAWHLPRAINAHEPPTHHRRRDQRVMNTLCERGILPIEGADHQTCVVRLGRVEANEMFAVEGDEHALLGRSKSQHRIVGNRLPGVAALHRGQHIVPKLPQRFNHWQRQVLIGVEPRHR